MNTNRTLIEAANVEDKINAHSRQGYHCAQTVAFENGTRVPYISLDEVMREVCEREGEPTQGPKFDLACRAIIEVLRVIIGDTAEKHSKKLSRETVGSRAIALAWTLDPSLFEGSPSLRRLAARYGCTAPLLSVHTGNLRDRFGVSNRLQQAHDHSRMTFNANKPDVVIDGSCIPEPEDLDECNN